MQQCFRIPFESLLQFQSMHPIKDATQAFADEYIITGFQSMHPIKDATLAPIVSYELTKNFNPCTL